MLGGKAFLIPAAQHPVYKNFFSCKQNSELFILPIYIEIRFLTGSVGVYDGYFESARKEGAVITHPSHGGVCLHNTKNLLKILRTASW